MRWPKLLQPRAVLLKNPKPAPSPAHAASAPATSPAPSGAARAAAEVEVAQEHEDAEQQPAAQPAKPGKPAKPQKRRNLPPTHFLAVRMSTQRVQEAINQLHGALQSHTPGLAPACEAPQKAHITLGVMRLEGQQEVQDAVALLQGRGASLLADAQALKPLTLQVKGLGTFRNSVLFLNVGPQPDLSTHPSSQQQEDTNQQQSGAHDKQDGRAPTKAADASEAAAVPSSNTTQPPSGAAAAAAGPAPPPLSSAVAVQAGSGDATATGGQGTHELSGLAHLHAIASSLGTCFAGVMKEEPHRPFNPHITVCKLSKLARGGGQGGRRGGRGGHNSRRGARAGGKGAGDKEGSGSGHVDRAGQEATAGCDGGGSGLAAAAQAQGDGETGEAMEVDAQGQQGEQGEGEGEQVDGVGGVQGVQGEQASDERGSVQPAAQPGQGTASVVDQVQQQEEGVQQGLDHQVHEVGLDHQRHPQQQQQQRGHNVDEGHEQHQAGRDGDEPMDAAAAAAVQCSCEPALLPHSDSRSTAGSTGMGRARKHGEAEEEEPGGDGGRCSKRVKREGGEGCSDGMEVEAAPSQAAVFEATEEGQPSSKDEHVPSQPGSAAPPEQAAAGVEGRQGQQSKDAVMEQLRALRQQRKEQRHLEKQQKRQQRQQHQQQQQQQQEGQAKGGDNETQEGVQEEEEAPPRGQKIRSIPVEAWAELKEIDAGEVVVSEVCLCAMAGPKQADGFYRVVASLPLIEQSTAQVETTGTFQPLASGALALPPSTATSSPPTTEKGVPEKRKRSGCCSIM